MDPDLNTHSIQFKWMASTHKTSRGKERDSQNGAGCVIVIKNAKKIQMEVIWRVAKMKKKELLSLIHSFIHLFFYLSPDEY